MNKGKRSIKRKARGRANKKSPLGGRFGKKRDMS